MKTGGSPMTTDREKLIEEAAKAIYNDDPAWGYVYEDDHGEHGAPWDHLGDDLHEKFRSLAKGALAAFEQASTPSDDEREALAEAFDEMHRITEGGCDTRGEDVADLVLRAGFRCTVQGEPSGHRAILIQQARAHADDYRRYDDTEDLVGTLVGMANMLAADAPVQGEPTDAEVNRASLALDEDGWNGHEEPLAWEDLDRIASVVLRAAAVREEGQGHG